MDQYEHVRRFPLNVVLASLGFETFKYRKAGTEGYGACPIHGSKKNTTCFSFDDEGRFNCFSCGAKGKGAIDLVIAIRKCGFQEAVKHLEGFRDTPRTRAPVQEQSPQRQLAPAPPSENPPFKSTYEKFTVPSAWLKERGLSEETLKRFEVFQYSNPARRSGSRRFAACGKCTFSAGHGRVENDDETLLVVSSRFSNQPREPVAASL